MFTNMRLRSLSQLPAPLLTAYLNSVPLEASRHAPVPWYVTWLKNEGKALGRSVPSDEQGLFREQLLRVEEFFRGRKPEGKGLTIFAGPTTWETVPLQLEIANELHWGKPALAQLQWAMAGRKAYGIVVIDRGGARFFGFWQGEITQLQETVFEMDVSRWKRKEMGHVARPGVRMKRGLQHDVFKHRVDAQYERACRETAEQANRLREWEDFSAIFLVGPERLIEPIKLKFAQAIREQLVLIPKDLGKLELHELRQHIEPEIEQWEREREAAQINDLLEIGHGVVVGIDETLAQLQEGKLRSLLVAHDFDSDLRQCGICGWTDRSADPACPVCKGERRPITLRETLPDLAVRFGADIQVLSGQAAEKLRGAGGIGAWLGQKQSESRRASAQAR